LLLLVANKPKPLTRSSDYKEASIKGKKLRPAPWLSLHVLSLADGSSSYGITASRKVGPSVIRNRIKRWVRNCVRSEKWPEQFISKRVVFVFRPQSSEDFYKQLKYKTFVDVFKKL
jgi:ribonuclease P protein component